MVNLGVLYSRPNRALTTLRDEIYRVYGYTPVRASEFVTGYKSASNFTGHNADSQGIVHAIDIFTDERGNLPEAEGREAAQRIVNELARRRWNKAYVIHDMGEVGVAPRIAGAWTGWEWAPYGGTSPHTDHIHVSVCDLYWGDPAPLPASVYDSTEPWGLGSVYAASGPISDPIIIEEFLMTLSDSDQLEVRDNLRKVVGALGAANGPGDVLEIRDNVRKIVHGQVDLAARVAAAEAAKGASVEQITDAVRAALADSVVNVDVNVGGQHG